VATQEYIVLTNGALLDFTHIAYLVPTRQAQLTVTTYFNGAPPFTVSHNDDAERLLVEFEAYLSGAEKPGGRNLPATPVEIVKVEEEPKIDDFTCDGDAGVSNI